MMRFTVISRAKCRFPFAFNPPAHVTLSVPLAVARRRLSIRIAAPLRKPSQDRIADQHVVFKQSRQKSSSLALTPD